jgi:hypothetical protein
LILAREQNGRRILIVGFSPHDSNFPLESAFPLLMAGGVEWMTHSVDEVADSLSTGEIDLPGPAAKIVAPSGKEVPFARKGADAHLFASEAGIYRITAPGGETTLAINPPALPAERVQLTPPEAADIEGEPIPPATWDMWRWLVIAAIAALWLEWWLFYTARERQRTAEVHDAPGEHPLPESEEELELEGGPREESVARKSNFAGR